MKQELLDKKEFLMSYQSEYSRARQCMREIEQIRELGDCLDQAGENLQAMGAKTGMHGWVEQLEEISQQLEQQVERALTARSAVSACLDGVKDERYRTLLRSRYLLGQTWDEVAQNMYMDERWVRRLHLRALEELVLPGQVSVAV